MRKKIIALLLLGGLMLSVPSWTAAQGFGDMTQDQTMLQDKTQDQTQDQVRIQLMDPDQMRTHLRDRLHITDSTMIQMQDRLRLQDQDQLCFQDVQQHWAREQIRTAYIWGLASGYPDGSFNPDRTITGAEAVLMMSRLMNSLGGIDAGAETPGNIDWDTVPLWARESIREATALRIASRSNLYGEQQLNRLQFAVMLAKSLGIEQADVPEGTEVFHDQAGVPAGDLCYILALKNLGIISGENGNFYPERLVTRAEAAVMLTKALNLLE